MPDREETRYWTADAAGDVTLLHARYVRHRFDPHTHDVFSLGVVESGVLAFEHGHRVHAVPAGAISLMNPGEVHTGYGAAAEGWTYRNFFVHPDVLARLAAASSPREELPFFARPAVDDAPLAALLLRAHRAQEAPEVLVRGTLLLGALAALLRRHGGVRPPVPARDPRGVAEARAYLHAHYAENPCLDDLARVAGLSPYHLLRVFRRSTGRTPHAYLVQLRVEAAARLLDAGAPIAEVALACGFADQSHLTRRFKRITGVTPARYAGRKIVQDRAHRHR